MLFNLVQCKNSELVQRWSLGEMPFVGPTATGASKTGLICSRKLPEQLFSKEDSKLLGK